MSSLKLGEDDAPQIPFLNHSWQYIHAGYKYYNYQLKAVDPESQVPC